MELDKKIGFFPLGFSQKILLEKLKTDGYYIVGFDASDTALCKDIVDEFYCTDDEEKILDILKDKNIDYIFTTQSDIGTRKISKIMENLNPDLDYSFNIANLFSRKDLLRKYIDTLDLKYIKQPKYVVLNKNELKINLENKVVVKPVDNQGSKGVFIIDDKDNLLDILNRSLKFSNISKIIVEEYIDLEEYTIEGVVIDNKPVILATSRKIHSKKTNQVAIGLRYYKFFNEKVLSLLQEDLFEIFNNIEEHIRYSLFHLEMKGEYLIDFGLRGGGHWIASVIVPHICEFDFEKYMIDKHFVNSSTFSFIPFSKVAALEFFEFEEGYYQKAIGTEFLEKYAKYWGFNFNLPVKIEKISDDTKRHGYFILLENDETQLFDMIQVIRKNVYLR